MNLISVFLPALLESYDYNMRRILRGIACNSSNKFHKKSQNRLCTWKPCRGLDAHGGVGQAQELDAKSKMHVCNSPVVISESAQETILCL